MNYCIAGIFRLEKIFTNFATWQKFYPRIISRALMITQWMWRHEIFMQYSGSSFWRKFPIEVKIFDRYQRLLLETYTAAQDYNYATDIPDTYDITGQEIWGRGGSREPEPSPPPPPPFMCTRKIKFFGGSYRYINTQRPLHHIAYMQDGSIPALEGPLG